MTRLLIHTGLIWILSCTATLANEGQMTEPDHLAASRTTFGDDVAFLRAHTEIILLSDAKGVAQVAVAPAWQGRVMTSSADRDRGRSFGWINRELIASGKLMPHINAFGGEDRVWLGPEGGQFSIYFPPGATFDFDHWSVPQALDTRPFRLVARTKQSASFETQFELTNYSGTQLRVAVQREVRVLEAKEMWQHLDVPPEPSVTAVAYESHNKLINTGTQAWRKETGLLSIWILGMFAPSASATIIVPIKAGSTLELGPEVTTDYFGPVPPDRLKLTANTIYFRADGKFRSKIGINPRRSRGVLGSYDPQHRVLTIVQFSQPGDAVDYVNSLWKLQKDPYGGDVANSYNDGPPAPGAKPLGPFFELESSSPAAALQPGGSIEHTHRTLHLTGPERELERVARRVLGVRLDEAKTVFATREPTSATPVSDVAQ